MITTIIVRTIILIVLILVFLVLSAFYSSAEIAYAKANAIRIRKQAEEGDRTAKIALRINENYTRSLSTVLVGNNLVNNAASSAATILFLLYFGQPLAPTLASIVITVLLLIFGETIPKIVAANAPDRFARLYAIPLRISMWIYFPVVWLVEKFVNLIAPIWTPKEKIPTVTPEELKEMVEDIEDEGVFSEQESEMIQSAIEFADTTVMEILVPRVDVFAIDIDDDELEITEEFYKYSRIPVYRDSIDNIIGILSTKKLLREIALGHEFEIAKLMYEPTFVHMTRTVSSLIKEFRRTQRQMAVVVDEYGGTMGIVTMEDIVEEIVGEIYDERDEVENDIRETGDGEYDVDGSLNIYDLFDKLDWEPTDFSSEYLTVGGWVTEVLDRFPKVGDSFTFDRLYVTVTEADPMRVERVHIVYTVPEEEAEEDEEDKEDESEEPKTRREKNHETPGKEDDPSPGRGGVPPDGYGR